MTIDEIPSFDKAGAIAKLTRMWGWLGPDAAEDILDQLADEIYATMQEVAA